MLEAMKKITKNKIRYTLFPISINEKARLKKENEEIIKKYNLTPTQVDSINARIDNIIKNARG